MGSSIYGVNSLYGLKTSSDTKLGNVLIKAVPCECASSLYQYCVNWQSRIEAACAISTSAVRWTVKLLLRLLVLFR